MFKDNILKMYKVIKHGVKSAQNIFTVKQIWQNESGVESK